MHMLVLLKRYGRMGVVAATGVVEWVKAFVFGPESAKTEPITFYSTVAIDRRKLSYRIITGSPLLPTVANGALVTFKHSRCLWRNGSMPD
jgi:hypothetical protein